ncbi:MAG TPA: dienelactone hydrolase family protein [Anaerolineales bacterium]|jgi:dipeptidyl aminopeptidase/acylaminoacyl peptidase
MKWTALFLVLALLVSCAPAASLPDATSLPSPVARHTAQPSVTPFPSPTRAPTWTPEPAATTAGLLITPSPNSQYGILALRVRQYGGGQVENLGNMGNFNGFTRYHIRYPSDGLNIDGFANIPRGDGPFPIIIVLHGYTDPSTYETLDYTTDAADNLAGQGYIVLHPSYRNFPPSDSGDTLFRVGYAIDVLNLIAIVQQSARQPGLFEHANPSKIGLWAHSMGGDIALKVAEISPYIKAVLLYSSMSGDEKINSKFFKNYTGSPENNLELQASDQEFALISPDHYYQNITAAIQIHHGKADSVVPVSVAEETCQKMKDARLDIRCYYYDGADHTFLRRDTQEFSPRVVTFFAKYLKK